VINNDDEKDNGSQNEKIAVPP